MIIPNYPHLACNGACGYNRRIVGYFEERIVKLKRRVAFLWRSRRLRAVLALTMVLSVAVPLTLVIESRKADALACACSIFGTPSTRQSFSNGGSIELGVRFIPNINGTIKGVRFYKEGAAMSGTHTGRLSTTNGVEITSATFSGESGSGWQDVSFNTPVAVTAGTTYIASVVMANGQYIASTNYFSSAVTNGPLTAVAGSSGNGVFRTASPPTAFTNSGNNANYWIDVAFFDDTTPQVNTVNPANNATGVVPGKALTATFDQTLDPTTVTSSTFSVKDAANNTVPGALSYDNTTRAITFIATNGFATNTTYTATIEGGTGTVIKNGIGIAMTADYSWSFTTNATNLCPCSLKDRVNPAGSTSVDDTGALELGVKVKPTTNGYITALRFYKPIISTETTHTGKIWSSNGTQLASVSFTNETDYGWQEARLSSPLQVTEGQLYIISYGTSTAVYQATGSGITSNLGSGYLVAHADNSAENAATGSGNRNGVFTGTAGNYPSTGSSNGAYYWIDAVFATESAPTYPLSVGVVQPTADAYAVPRSQVVSAKFNRALNGATVTNSTFRLFDSSNNAISGTGAYNAATGQATFTPTSSLTYGQQYTAKLSATVADAAGTQLGSEYSWSFTVGSQLSSDPSQGPGGPILVITSTANKYSPYYAEIVRTEGFNYFDVKDIATVNASTLNAYTAVVLAEMTLSQPQADMFSTWVNAGGNLIAMRPDSKLASLLGLTSAGTTRSNQYLLINTATTPGNGLVSETIQFKGTADNYTLNGATAVATFYSDASTSTTAPAVTSRSVGSNGGSAAAFTYDLAKSVIAQHQGNQAWVGQNRDFPAVAGPVRANDLFYGNMVGDVQPDWVDPNKFHIPQADEQQRLLANILIETVKDERPLPRFWYLPGDYKTALVFAGDDHGLSNALGTEITLNDWLNESSTNCSIVDWQCVRASHYVYSTSSLTNARATQFHNQGFEIGDHVANGCVNYSSFATLSSAYTSDLATWRAKYTSIPNQTTHRFHCYVWSDWDSQTRVAAANGIRYDLNYVALGATWVGSKAPIMTGSGMNMRLTDADGDMMDVRQGVTNLDDQSGGINNINALVDNATGSNGYYGIFGTHYDMSNTYDATLFAAAKARNIPLISSKQALAWWDGRDGSTFSDMTGSDGLFNFTIAAAEGAHNLKAMLPIQDAGGTLAALTLADDDVTYDTRSVKGIQYAVFNALPGEYTAEYTDYDPTPDPPDPTPDPDTGGGSETPSTGSSSGSESTPAPSSLKVTTTTTPAATDEETEDVTTQTTTPAQSNNNTDTQKDPAKQTEQQEVGVPWIPVLLISLGFGGLIWFLLALRRRRRHAEDITSSF